ncbi:unnamed protein product [Bursaphelenchus okinawaensis]|uniref:Uncharacterized protein n=1 Tax=Bursaphelenchus okinawaensis TaxID=465554 RepID=A0A811LNN6_9BILA|nr:unnamed protein product [Bursaphelenchus okinawaensis]CAG9126229.1 unnamed protein product [Bursaphelenchus okinawaensis]
MSRVVRAYRKLAYWPRQAWKLWPEQMIVFCTFGSVGVFGAIREAVTNPYSIERPWYRSNYDVVRPDARIVHLWRTPEEYPAKYETNRNAGHVTTYKKDYGYNL